MECVAALCHLRWDFTTWQLVTQLQSHAWSLPVGKTVSVMWVSYKRLGLVYLSLNERYDRLTDEKLLNVVGPPLPSGNYLTTLINIKTLCYRLYIKNFFYFLLNMASMTNISCRCCLMHQLVTMYILVLTELRKGKQYIWVGRDLNDILFGLKILCQWIIII